VPAALRGGALLGYAPLDQGPAQMAMSGAPEMLRSLRAAYVTMSLTPERLSMRFGAAGDLGRLVAYFQPRPGPSILGMGEGAGSILRITFSPDLLWSAAQSAMKQVNPAADMASMAQGVLGFDLDKDLIQNLTGEIVSASYHTAPGGTNLADYFFNGFMIAATRDDAATRRVTDRFGEMLGGAMGTFANTMSGLGVKYTYRAEAGDRKVHFNTFELDAEHAKIAGFSRIEMYLTSVAGGMVLGFGAPSLAQLKKHVGAKPSAVLDRFPLVEERELFHRSPFAVWGMVGSELAGRFPLEGLEAISPDVAGGMKEFMEVMQLVYDGLFGLELANDRAEFVYQLTFL
jgi:hypothetical protein